MHLNLQCTPIFERNYDAEKRIVVNRGGTRSSKTVSIMQLAVLFLFSGYVKPGLQVQKGVWSTVRKFSNNLDKTVIRDFEEQLLLLGVMDLVKRNKTAKTYTYGQRMVEFFGADEEQKIRGAKRVVLHCNEGNEISFNDWYQLIFRTEERAYIDFNPDDENVWINKEIEQKRQYDKNDVEVIVSTYQDNTFLPQSLINEIEYLRDTDVDFWKIFGLGEYGSIKGLIFENWDIRTLPGDAVLLGYALDFGFTNDPTAIPAIYKSGGELWFKELLYERRLTNRDISDQMNELGLNHSLDIIADSAEPKSIEEIHRLNWNIHPAKKGADSIKNSIDILRRFVCHITPDSVNLIKEHKTYKWKEDKNGNYLNEPVDFNNHLIDGLRYFALNKLKIDNTTPMRSKLPYQFAPSIHPDLDFVG